MPTASKHLLHGKIKIAGKIGANMPEVPGNLRFPIISAMSYDTAVHALSQHAHAPLNTVFDV